MKIGDREIGPDFRPYVIAEISSNHHQDLGTALELIAKAAEAGADAVKFQTYKAHSITLDSDKDDFRISEGPWKGRTLFELYEASAMDWSWHDALLSGAKEHGLDFISSAFDARAVDELVKVGVDALKIASFEVTDHPLIEYASSAGLPVILSTGTATKDEISEAVEIANRQTKNFSLLHCVSAYPAKASDYRLRNIPDMARRYGVTIGLSDHTLGLGVASGSVALGASIFEKHFTLDNNSDGSDDFFSATPTALQAYIDAITESWESLQGPSYERTAAEEYNLRFRRSLYFTKDLPIGHEISDQDVRSIRPGFGLHPRYKDQIIGRNLVVEVQRGTRVSWEAVEELDHNL